MPLIKDALDAYTQLNIKDTLLLMAKAISKSKEYVLTHSDYKITQAQYRKFEVSASRRLKNEPMAYILGFQPFMGYDFKVNSSVLIPRPETESLAQMLVEDMNKPGADKRKMFAIDIGTGSGCIACYVKKIVPKANVIASDISPAALSVVKYNAKKLSTVLKIIHSNLLDEKLSEELKKCLSRKGGTSIFIAANLPYLPHSDAQHMQKDVIDYEPKIALFADDDGAYLIKKCIQQFKNFINQSVIQDNKWNFYFEIDPPQAETIKKFAKENFPSAKVEIKKDLCGRKRFLTIATEH